MADVKTLMALARADQDRFARLATGTGQVVAELFGQITPITDDQLAEWQRTVVPVVQGAQQAAAMQRVGYLAAYSTAAGNPARPDVNVTGLIGGLRNGTAAAEVYARPVVTARRVLSEGGSFEDAIHAGSLRAGVTAETDVMLAAREAEREAMLQMPRVVGYRRVPNGGACKLCLAAATQRYNVRDLRPCHANCRCGVVPIYGTKDPGPIIDREARDALKRAGVIDELTAEKQLKAARKRGDQRAVDRLTSRRDALRAELAKTPRAQYAIHEHGELGPTLGAPGHKFTGRAQLVDRAGESITRDSPLGDALFNYSTNMETASAARISAEDGLPNDVARRILSAVDESTLDAPVHRGITIEGGIDAVEEQFASGTPVDIAMGSFSSDPEIARKFAQWSRDSLEGDGVEVFFTVPKGANGLRIPYDDLEMSDYFAQEREAIVAGKFRVREVRRGKTSDYYEPGTDERDVLEVILELA